MCLQIHRWGVGGLWWWTLFAKYLFTGRLQLRAAVAEGIEWSSSNLKVGSSIPSLPKSACRSVLEQDAEPWIVLIDALYECVCDWVNVKLYCSVLWVVIKTRKALYKYKSIYHLHGMKGSMLAAILQRGFPTTLRSFVTHAGFGLHLLVRH